MDSKKKFYIALKAMLKNNDALEDEKIPIEDHPHTTFIRYLINRTRCLYDSKKLKPIHFLRIPFEIANGHGEGIDEKTQKKYKEYLDELLKHYKTNKKWNIVAHIESLRQLKETSRVFNFKKERTQKEWGGWYPNEWRKKHPDSWESNIDDYQNIAKEFRFAHSLALFANSCKDQQKSAKDKYPLYYLGIIQAKDIYCNEPRKNTELDTLRKTLETPYSEKIPFEFFEKNLELFSPYYLTPQEMDTFFKWAICHCVHNNKNPHLPFLKELWTLGKLFKVHCFHFDFLDTAGSKINDHLYVKIKQLKEYLINGALIFPPNDYSIENDFSKMIRFLGREFPIDSIIALTQNLFSFDKEYRDAQKVVNTGLLEKNKALIDEKKTSLSILDWLDYPLTKNTDEQHRSINFILKAICIYNTNPKLYNTKMLEMGPALLKQIHSIKQAIAKDEPVAFSTINNESIDESIVPELCVILGVIERLLYPCKIVSSYDNTKKERILFILKYIANPNNRQVIASRFSSILGDIIKHPKITRLVTSQDIINNTRCLESVAEFSNKFCPIVFSETMRLISENNYNLELMSSKELDALQSVTYEEYKKQVEQCEKDLNVSKEIYSIHGYLLQQAGIIPPCANDNS